jgi:anaerobic selenocysteine-containing dehydrogenase
MGEYNLPEQRARINPRDAAERQIVQDAEIRIYNDLGEVVCRADLSDKIRPGVIMLPKGAWRRSSINGSTATALCPDHLNDIGGAACYNDARVQVELHANGE